VKAAGNEFSLCCYCVTLIRWVFDKDCVILACPGPSDGQEMGASALEQYLEADGAIIAHLLVEFRPSCCAGNGLPQGSDVSQSPVETRGYIALGIVAIRATANGKLQHGVSDAALSVLCRRIVKGRNAGGDGSPTPLRLTLFLHLEGRRDSCHPIGAFHAANGLLRKCRDILMMPASLFMGI
jgi:hypothetical protein